MKTKIFSYTDYHTYLNDWYGEQKKVRNITHQLIAEQAGFKSHSYVQRVFSGQKALSRKSLCVFSEILKHTEKEAEYFILLVHFNMLKLILNGTGV